MKLFRFSRADFFAGRIFPWIFFVNTLGTAIVLGFDPTTDPLPVVTEASGATLSVRLAGDRPHQLNSSRIPTAAALPAEAKRTESGAGSHSPDPEPSPGAGTASARAEFRANYLSKIIQQVSRHKRFPRLERERGRQADVVVRFVILQNGRIERLELAQASAYAGFNQEALASVERSLPFPAIPAELGQDRLVLRIRLKFRLEDT